MRLRSHPHGASLRARVSRETRLQREAGTTARMRTKLESLPERGLLMNDGHTWRAETLGGGNSFVPEPTHKSKTTSCRRRDLTSGGEARGNLRFGPICRRRGRFLLEEEAENHENSAPESPASSMARCTSSRSAGGSDFRRNPWRETPFRTSSR